ncbi:hypothetical protein RCL1_006344 [Eukaryota sp. TZLM3-RCL]
MPILVSDLIFESPIIIRNHNSQQTPLNSAQSRTPSSIRAQSNSPFDPGRLREVDVIDTPVIIHRTVNSGRFLVDYENYEAQEPLEDD